MRVPPAAATADEQDLYEEQLSLFLDPNDPAVIARAGLEKAITEAGFQVTA